jgi:pimeloyl-ACP methyl ester carboxylesterase
MDGSESTRAEEVGDAIDAAVEAGTVPDLGPRAITYPYRRIERPAPTPPDGPDPYGDDDPEWLRIDWRQHVHRIEIGGTPVNYAEIGSGPPVLFVHGLGGCWQNWLENLPFFAAAGRRAIALDLPGFGASPMPPWEVTVPAYGRLLNDFCAALGLEDVVLVGNSLGGFIAAETAIAVPAWIERLVLVSAAGISHAEMKRGPVVATARMLHLLNPVARTLNTAGLRRPGLRQAAFQGVFRHPQRIRRELLYEFSVNGVGRPGFLPSVASLTGYDFLDRLPEIAVPTLIVWGRDDLVVPASDAPGYRDRISDCELQIFDDCGHVPMAERPVRFNRAVARLAGIEPAAGGETAREASS